MVLGISIRKCWCDYKILGGGYAGVWVRVSWEGDVKTIILYICWRKHLQRIKGRKEVSKRALRQCRSDDYESRRKEDWAGRVSDCSANLPLARLIVSLWFKVTHPEAVLRDCVSHLGICSQWLAPVHAKHGPSTNTMVDPDAWQIGQSINYVPCNRSERTFPQLHHREW